MTLYIYFSMRYLKSFISVFIVFFSILFLLDMVEQLRKFASVDVDFGDILHLSLLSVPASVYQILPLITILATLSMFIGLARSSELVVTRAAGRSALKSLMAPVLMAVLIGMIAVAFFNPIVAGTTKKYELAENKFRNGQFSTLSVSSEGLWLRQGGPAGQTVINAQGSNLDGTKLSNVSFFSFSLEGTPTQRIEADIAELGDGAWILQNARIWDLLTVNPERSKETHDSFQLESQLTRNQIRDSFGTPSSIPIWDLPSFIATLDEAGFSAIQHRVWFQFELTLPIMLVAMVLLGSALTMRHTRQGGAGLMVLLSILMGFGLFFIRNFAQVLSENNQIPIYLAAWGPPIAAIFIAMALLLHWEDG